MKRRHFLQSSMAAAFTASLPTSQALNPTSLFRSNANMKPTA